jgi:hypothetical protein
MQIGSGIQTQEGDCMTLLEENSVKKYVIDTIKVL